MDNIKKLVAHLKRIENGDYPVVADWAAIVKKETVREAVDALEAQAAEIERLNEVLGEACARMVKVIPHPDGDPHILACPICGSGEYLENEDGNRNDFCGQCGQAIDWSEEE